MSECQIVLVHGTFGQESNWFRRGSHFRINLDRKLNESGISPIFSEFVWSGKNGHEARHDASRCLAEQLAKTKLGEHYTTYVIAHSHGGNILRNALRKMNKSNLPGGIVTLGTPFIFARRRKMATFLWLFILPLFTSLFVIGLYLDLPGWTMIFAVPALLFYVSQGMTKAQIIQETVAAELATHFADIEDLDLPILNITTLLDEARLLLKVWHWFGESLHILIDFSVKLFYFGLTALLLIAVMGHLNVGAISLEQNSIFASIFHSVLNHVSLTKTSANESAITQYFWIALWGSLVLLSLLLSLVALLLVPVVAIVPWFVRTQWFAFGEEKLAWYLTHEVKLETVASKKSRLYWVKIRDAWRQSRLRHASYYLSDDVISAISGFINGSEIGMTKSFGQFNDLNRWLRYAFGIFVFVSLLAQVVPIGAHIIQWLRNTIDKFI